MTPPPEAIQLVRQWIAKAQEDIQTVDSLLRFPEECPAGVVCFHSQQCIEKYVKALLVLHSIPFPKTHDLIDLLRLVPMKARPALPQTDLALLNRYAVESRYPGDWGVITTEEALEAAAVARRLREAIQRILPQDVLQ